MFAPELLLIPFNHYSGCPMSLAFGDMGSQDSREAHPFTQIFNCYLTPQREHREEGAHEKREGHAIAFLYKTTNPIDRSGHDVRRIV
jgi:hypothetical protein